MRPGKQEGLTPSVFRFKGSSECLAYLNPVGTQPASPRWPHDQIRPNFTHSTIQQFNNSAILRKESFLTLKLMTLPVNSNNLGAGVRNEDKTRLLTLLAYGNL